MFAVLVERGCADAVQFAARQRRLQEVGLASIAPSAFPAPTRVCISSMKSTTPNPRRP